MNEEILLRRKEEIEALSSFYGEDLIPSLEEVSGNNSVIPTEGPWFIKLIPTAKSPCTNANGKGVPILEVRLPPKYPLSGGEVGGLPEPILHNTISYNFSYERKKSLEDELMEMYEPDADMDVAIMWAERCRQEFLDFGSQSAMEADFQTNTSSRTDEHSSSDHQFEQNQQKSGDSSQLGRLCIRFLNYNHLLHGKSHKKEADLVSCAAKMGLSGFVVYGTPGIVGLLVCYGPSDTKKSHGSYGVGTMDCDVAEFAKECGRIGKRATLLDFTVELTPDGLHPSCLDADDKSNGTNGRGIEENKKSTHSKNDGRSKRGGGDKLIGSGLKNFTPNRKGIGALLLDLLGPDKINGGVDTFTATVSKAGLKSFDSFGDLKQVFTSHGLHDTFFPQILGLT